MCREFTCLRAFVAVALVTGALLTGAASARAEPGSSASQDCVRTRTEARYSGYGYDHIVHVTNGCEKPMQCSITTSANPQPTSVTVAPTKTESVVTFRGSPAREFEAQVSCQPTG